MAYDGGLAQRIRDHLDDEPDMVEKAMFGGVGFMVRGNMAVGVHGDGLIVRVGPERYEQALGRPHVTVFDMTGRPMKGWVVVEPAGCASDQMLGDWVARGLAFARSLPPK